MGAVNDSFFLVAHPCIIYEEVPTLRRSYARCRANHDALHEYVEYILVPEFLVLESL